MFNSALCWCNNLRMSTWPKFAAAWAGVCWFCDNKICYVVKHDVKNITEITSSYKEHQHSGASEKSLRRMAPFCWTPQPTTSNQLRHQSSLYDHKLHHHTSLLQWLTAIVINCNGHACDDVRDGYLQFACSQAPSAKLWWKRKLWTERIPPEKALWRT